MFQLMMIYYNQMSLNKAVKMDEPRIAWITEHRKTHFMNSNELINHENQKKFKCEVQGKNVERSRFSRCKS